MLSRNQQIVAAMNAPSGITVATRNRNAETLFRIQILARESDLEREVAALPVLLPGGQGVFNNSLARVAQTHGATKGEVALVGGRNQFRFTFTFSWGTVDFFVPYGTNEISDREVKVT